MAKSILDKYKSIDQSKISKEAKMILLKLKGKTKNFKETTPETNKAFNTFYDKIVASKPQAIKGNIQSVKPSVVSKPNKPKPAAATTAEMFKLAKAKRIAQGLSTSKADIQKDALRPAMKKGYRISKNGNKYWEGRDNRIDRQPRKKYPKLEKGGMMAEGGEVGQGFLIRDMREKLNRMFPDTFGFTVGNVSKEGNKTLNSAALIVDLKDPYRGLEDKDIQSKLFFPQYKRDHNINFRMMQGGENTYFYFELESEKGDKYIGQFGFKDRGDVPSSYITSFIAFLMEQYGLPFEIKHEVMAKGGRIGKDFNGSKSKETWGKSDLYEMYDNNLDLVADVHDYYKKMGTDISEDYAKEMKKDMIDVLQHGKITFSDGRTTTTFAHGGKVGEPHRMEIGQ